MNSVRSYHVPMVGNIRLQFWLNPHDKTRETNILENTNLKAWRSSPCDLVFSILLGSKQLYPLCAAVWAVGGCGGCAAVWAMWAVRHVAVWLCGCVAVWLCDMWLCGYVTARHVHMWLCGMWRCGCVTMWLCGYVAVWLCGM